MIIHCWLCKKQHNPIIYWQAIMNKKITLLIDAVINFIVGIILMLFPFNISQLLGLPKTEQYFYPVMFGAVVFGIGIALTIECFKEPKRIIGLGLAGAIAINLCGGIVLTFWLILGNLDIPFHGMLILSFVAFIVIFISIVEIIIFLKSGSK